jgi:hypothetical protein
MSGTPTTTSPIKARVLRFPGPISVTSQYLQFWRLTLLVVENLLQTPATWDLEYYGNEGQETASSEIIVICIHRTTIYKKALRGQECRHLDALALYIHNLEALPTMRSNFQSRNISRFAFNSWPKLRGAIVATTFPSSRIILLGGSSRKAAIAPMPINTMNTI